MKQLVTDVTESKVAGDKASLPSVMNLCNNETVAWSMTRRPNLTQIMKMLDDLEPFLDRPALIHSDQGWQHQQLAYQKRLKQMEVAQSTSRKAACLGDACIEGFLDI